MKVGDLVRCKTEGRIGIVERIDPDWYGAGKAYKVINAERGKAICSDMVDYLPRPTERGIRDRVMVCWSDGTPEYRESIELEKVE